MYSRISKRGHHSSQKVCFDRRMRFSSKATRCRHWERSRTGANDTGDSISVGQIRSCSTGWHRQRQTRGLCDPKPIYLVFYLKSLRVQHAPEEGFSEMKDPSGCPKRLHFRVRFYASLDCAQFCQILYYYSSSSSV